MNKERVIEIVNSSSDLRSMYDKLSENELKGISFEDFEKMVYEVSEDDSDEVLNDTQMESVAGGIAFIDDFVKWIAKLGRKKIKEIVKDF